MFIENVVINFLSSVGATYSFYKHSASTRLQILKLTSIGSLRSTQPTYYVSELILLRMLRPIFALLS